MKRFFLEYCKDPLQRTFFSVVEFTNIGRMEGNNICLEDPEISRRHARVVLQDGRCVLYDLGSRNGTCVNGLRVQGRVLKHGDVIRVGQTTLRFVESEELGRQIALEETVEGLVTDFDKEIQEQMDLAETLLEPLPIGVAIINDKMEVLYCNRSLAAFRARGVHQERGYLGKLLGCNALQGEKSTCGILPECASCPLCIAAARLFREKVPTSDMELDWQSNVPHSSDRICFSLLPLPYRLKGESLAQLIWERSAPKKLDREGNGKPGESLP